MSQHEPWDILSSVGITALGVAAGRAIESTRPDRLIDDPYATAFLRAVESPIPPAPRWPDEHTDVTVQEAILVHSSVYIGLRSRFFDDYLVAASAEPVRQVVIIAAGLDTRAYRLDWPAGLRLFELDQPEVLRFKDDVLRGIDAKPRCERHSVPIDLRESWSGALRDAGFTAGTPTAWLAEGLLPYLPAGAEQQLFRHIDELSAPGSRLGVEQILNLPDMIDNSGLREVREASGFDMAQLVHTEERPDPVAWLGARGWTTTVVGTGTVAERYHRVLDDPLLARLPGTPLRLGGHTAFLTGERSA
jgi:methyltransferase (TIGR00027 family)